MAELSRTYVFLGKGTIWDRESNKALCRFDKDGKFATNDQHLIGKLLAMRVPFVHDDHIKLQNAEYAIEILTDRVNFLEQINAEQRAQIELYKQQVKVKEDEESIEDLRAELDYYGIPYIVQSTPATLRALLDEFRAYQRNAVKYKLIEGRDHIV